MGAAFKRKNEKYSELLALCSLAGFCGIYGKSVERTTLEYPPSCSWGLLGSQAPSWGRLSKTWRTRRNNKGASGSHHHHHHQWSMVSESPLMLNFLMFTMALHRSWSCAISVIWWRVISDDGDHKRSSGSEERPRHVESKDSRAGWRGWLGDDPTAVPTPCNALGLKERNLND